MIEWTFPQRIRISISTAALTRPAGAQQQFVAAVRSQWLHAMLYQRPGMSRWGTRSA